MLQLIQICEICQFIFNLTLYYFNLLFVGSIFLILSIFYNNEKSLNEVMLAILSMILAGSIYESLSIDV